jgi:hypothetical protein
MESSVFGVWRAMALSEVPAAQRRRTPRPLDHYARQHRDRDEAIQSAYASGGHYLKAIGEHLGLHYSRVSRIVAAGEKAKGNTRPYILYIALDPI